MKPLISVIIPVYNVEKYIHTCIDSTIEQTYKNLEIILVDDGSKDNSGHICDEYARKDSRITVIHKENGGLSDARNAAIDIAKGDFITFIDSDDFVKPDYVEYLYDLISRYSADLSICDIYKIFEGKSNKEPLKTNEFETQYNSQEALEEMLYQNKFDTSACAKLYKVELFNDIRYPKGKYYEDLATEYKLFSKCNKIVHGNSIKYYYLIRKNSITTSQFSIKRMELIDIAEEMLDFILDKYPGIKKAAISRYVSANFQILLQAPNEKNQFKEEKTRIINNIKKYRTMVLFDKNTRAKNKIAIICSYISIPFTRFIYNHK